MSIFTKIIVWLAGGKDHVEEVRKNAEFIAELRRQGGELIIHERGGIEVKAPDSYWRVSKEDEEALRRCIRNGKR